METLRGGWSLNPQYGQAILQALAQHRARGHKFVYGIVPGICLQNLPRTMSYSHATFLICLDDEQHLWGIRYEKALDCLNPIDLRSLVQPPLN